MRSRLFHRILVLMAIDMMAAAALSISCAADCAKSAANSTESFEGNLLKVTSQADFDAGKMRGVASDPETGDGAIRLEEGRLVGSFESAVYECSAFGDMTACWSAAVYEGGEIEVLARARFDGTWTKYLTWGPYTPFADRGSTEGKIDECAYVDQDTFCMKDGRTADAVQMKVVLRRSAAEDASPVLRMMSMTFRGGEMQPLYAEEPVSELPDSMLIEAPAVSQLTRSPLVAHDICSPTTVSVMMNSRVPELNVLPEECALNIKDEAEDIFGSWAFSASGAGLYGFNVYTQFTDKEILLQELAKGHATGINVRYTNQKGTDYPYMDGTFDRTGGHWICLIGYEYEDGVHEDDHLYFYASDSFAERDATSYRRYRWTELKECMQGMSYIIPDSEQEVTGDLAPGVSRQTAVLTKDTGRTNTWLLQIDGQDVDMERFISGSGVLAFTSKDSGNEQPVETEYSIPYENAVFTLANQTFCYDVIYRKDGSLVFDAETIRRKLGVEEADSPLTLYAVSDRGVCYEAELTE